jgi:hypothetical protein
MIFGLLSILVRFEVLTAVSMKIAVVVCAVSKSWSAHARVANIVRCTNTLPPRKHQVVLVIDDGKGPLWFEIRWEETDP